MSSLLDMVTVERPGGTAPYAYTLAASEAFQPQTVTATFDGSGAGGTFLPTLSLYAQDGTLLGRWPVADADEVAAGGSAEVSWFRNLRRPCPPCPSTGGGAVCPTATGAIASFTSTATSSFSMTLAKTVGCTGLVVVVTACYDPLGSAADVNTCTDSKGHSYSRGESSTLPNITIGSSQDATGGFGSPALQLCESFARVCTAGDTVAGDTITVNLSNPSGHTQTIAAFVVNLTGITGQAVGNVDFGGIQYSDGMSYPNGGGTSTELSWVSGLGESPAPMTQAAQIAACCAQPGGGSYAPLNGSLVAQVDGDISLAFSLVGSITADTVTDPGGTWSSARDVICGNYQFAALSGS